MKRFVHVDQKVHAGATQLVYDGLHQGPTNRKTAFDRGASEKGRVSRFRV